MRGATENIDEHNYTQLLPSPSQPPPYSPQQQQQSTNENYVSSRTRNSSINDTTTSGFRSTRRNQLTLQGRSGPIDEHVIREPPPPYPGLPVNSSSSGFVPPAIGASSPNGVMNTAPFPPVIVEQSQVVYVLSPYGQVSGIVPLLPGQPQYSTVAQPRSTEGRASQSFPPLVSIS